MADAILNAGHTHMGELRGIIASMRGYKWGGVAAAAFWTHSKMWAMFFDKDARFEYKLCATYNQYAGTTFDTLNCATITTGSTTGTLNLATSATGIFDFAGSYTAPYQGLTAGYIATPVIRINAMSGASSGMIDLNGDSYTSIAYTSTASGIFGITIGESIPDDNYTVWYDYLETTESDIENGYFTIQSSVSAINSDGSATAWVAQASGRDRLEGFTITSLPAGMLYAVVNPV